MQSVDLISKLTHSDNCNFWNEKMRSPFWINQWCVVFCLTNKMAWILNFFLKSGVYIFLVMCFPTAAITLKCKITSQNLSNLFVIKESKCQFFGDYENLKVGIKNHSMKLEKKFWNKKLCIRTVAFVTKFFKGYWKYTF